MKKTNKSFPFLNFSLKSLGNTNALIYAEWNTDICLSIEIKFIYLFIWRENLKKKTKNTYWGILEAHTQTHKNTQKS